MYFCLAGDFPAEPGTTFRSAVRRRLHQEVPEKQISLSKNSFVTPNPKVIFSVCASFPVDILKIESAWKPLRSGGGEKARVSGLEGKRRGRCSSLG